MQESERLFGLRSKWFVCLAQTYVGVYTSCLTLTYVGVCTLDHKEGKSHLLDDV